MTHAPSKLNLGFGPVRACPGCGEPISTSGRMCGDCMKREILAGIAAHPQASAANDASRQDRMRAEHHELCSLTAKLSAFINDPAFKELDEEDQSLLRAQRSAMLDYERALSSRIARL